LAFAPDGTLLVAAGNRATVYNAESNWRLTDTIGASDSAAGLVDRVLSLDFSPDGRTLLTGGGLPSRGGELKLWNAADGRLVREFRGAHGDTILDARFSPDGRYVAFQNTTDGIPSIIVRSVQGNERFTIPRLFGDGPEWSPDGDYLYFGTPNSIRRLKVRTNPTFNVLSDAETVVYAPGLGGFDLSWDGRHLVIAASAVSVSDSDETDEKFVWLQNWSQHVRRTLDD
jgi:WD40 repeat protein